jgi:hypothetical protein
MNPQMVYLNIVLVTLSICEVLKKKKNTTSHGRAFYLKYF